MDDMGPSLGFIKKWLFFYVRRILVERSLQ